MNQGSQVSGAEGPNWMVVAAILARVEAWKKETADREKQSVALKMRAAAASRRAQQKERKAKA